jgi:hypothetical protein
MAGLIIVLVIFGLIGRAQKNKEQERIAREESKFTGKYWKNPNTGEVFKEYRD